MSENKKSETTEKVMTKYDKKVQRRKEEEKKEQARAKRSKIITAVVVVAVVAFIAYFPISKYVAIHSTYMQVGEYEVTEAEFDYYYNMGVNSYVSQYGTLLPYLGLDVTKDFADQMYSDYATWDDYFQQSAAVNLTQTKALVAEAKANGFEADVTEKTNEHIEMLKEAATKANESLGSYIKANFGKYATLNNIQPIIEESYYASAYYEQVADSKEITDEEITAYYNENKDSYDSVDFKVVEVKAEIPEGETTTDEDGKETKAEPTEEQIAEAMEAAKKLADEKLETVDADGELKENVKKAAASSVYEEWLFEAERKAGDTTVIEDKTNNRYFVLQFEGRYLDEANTVNVRVISTTEDKGEAILEEWNNTGANEDAFSALAEKYSEETFTEGGLFENLTATALSDELSTWMLDETRKAGDVTAIKATDGLNYVLYYVSEGQAEWKVAIENVLKSKLMQEYMTGITESFEVVDVKGKLTYLAAVAAQEAADQAAETETSEEETQQTETTPETESGADAE